MVVRGPYVYPFNPAYNEATITYPDNTKDVYRLSYRSPSAATQGKAAFLAENQAKLAAKRQAAYDELFTNAPFQALWNSLDKYWLEADQHLSLAYKRPATQSSEGRLPMHSSLISSAKYAVDGLTEQFRYATTSAGEANPWWKVDLGRDTDGRAIPIKGVSVYFQPATRRWRASVEVLDDRGTKIWSRAIDSTSAAHYFDIGHVFGRYVQVRMTNNDKSLQLAEVYVWPPVPPARR